MIFSVFQKKNGFLGILGPPYCGIGATIRIGREMLCLPYTGFFFENVQKKVPKKLPQNFWIWVEPPPPLLENVQK